MDIADKRTLELSNGNKYHIEPKAPYGFWYIHMDKGQTAAKLSGAYTSYKAAEDAVKSYVENETKKKITEVKDKVNA